MRIAHVLLIAAVLLAGVGANADNVQGSVFLMPVTSQFSSFGTAEYLSTLNQRIVDDIAGVHSVSGPQVYSTTFSESDGFYDEFFEGPADPGACTAPNSRPGRSVISVFISTRPRGRARTLGVPPVVGPVVVVSSPTPPTIIVPMSR